MVDERPIGKVTSHPKGVRTQIVDKLVEQVVGSFRAGGASGFNRGLLSQ
jgi:hypothetical protein